MIQLDFNFDGIHDFGDVIERILGNPAQCRKCNTFYSMWNFVNKISPEPKVCPGTKAKLGRRS